MNAHQVKQLKGQKTGVADSIWLARVCQFGLGTPSMVPSRTFREVRNLSRHRRLTASAASVRNRVHKVLDRSGCRIGGILSDIFGKNCRRIIDGLLAAQPTAANLAMLSGHVRRKLELLEDPISWSLSSTDRVLLRDLIFEHDALQARIAAFHTTLSDHLQPWRDRNAARWLRQLETCGYVYDGKVVWQAS